MKQQNFYYGLRWNKVNIYTEFYNYISKNKIKLPVTIDHEEKEAELNIYKFPHQNIAVMRKILEAEKNKYTSQKKIGRVLKVKYR